MAVAWKWNWDWAWGWGWVWGLLLAVSSTLFKTLIADYLVKPIARWLGDRFRAELPGLELLLSEGIVPSKSSNDAFNKIMEALKEDNVNMIGVWGMGGVGKTTLVKRVGKNAKELKLFKVKIVTVSQTPSIGDIQNQIADFLNVKFQKTTKEGRAEELWNQLEKEKKVLIILDDVWKKVDLKEIGLPLHEGGKGCKIILTTRRMAVCRDMGCQPKVPIDVLDDDEAWTLFRMNANLDERVSREIMQEAEKVAKECKGLPVAIVTLARALNHTHTLAGWTDALKKLESSRLIEISDIEDDEKNAYVCIRTSYDYLKKETTKRCFLLCALYPEDHSIDAEHLVRHAAVLELYDNTHSVEEVRSEVLEAIKYLQDSCLLLQDEDDVGYTDIGRHVQLHDMVRDVALWITSKKESGFMVKSRVALLNNSSEPCKAISLLDGEKKTIPEKLVCPELELMLLNNCDVPVLCFQKMQNLKVLSLTIEKYSGRMISLYALQFLKRLRSLHLVNFENVKFLGNLTTLEIFSLRGSEFEGSSKSERFADELRKLENLKILDLADCSFPNGFPADVITRLTKLEELFLRSMKGKRTAIFREINLLTRLTTLSLAASSLEFPKDFWFPKLKRYDICINRSGYSAINGSGSRLQVERSLIVEKFDLNLVSRSLENIEFLRVSELEHECFINRRQKMLVPRILQNLKEVSIEKCENLKVVFQNAHENVEPLLSNLKLLNLHYLPKLSDIWELPIQHVRLEALVELKIWSCQSLKSIFSISLARSLVLLENLDISLCDELEQIVTESEGNEEEISSNIISPNSLCFPKLRKVNIACCDGLEHIFPTLMAPQGVPQLEHLSVHYCSKLKQLIRRIEGRTRSGGVLQQLQFSKPLAKFSVVDCPLLRDPFVPLDIDVAQFKKVRLSAFKGSLFNSQKHLQLSEIIEDHNLVPEVNEDGQNGLNSLQLEDCKDVECLVDNRRWNGPTSAFTHLETLSIISLPSLKTLCKGRAPQGFLKSLRELTVEKCFNLEVIFQMDDPSCNVFRWIVRGSAIYTCSLQSLKVVNIKMCGKLESLFSHSLIQSLVMLEELSIFDCDGLRTLITELEDNDGETESNTSLPKLKHLYISRCPGLQYAFPITMAKGLPALASISVSDCGELKQVFGEVEEQNGVEQNAIVHVRLGNLQHLILRSLSNLSCFAPENYSFEAPLLKSLEVYKCPRFMNFTISTFDNQLHLTRAGSSSRSRLNAEDGWEVLESLVCAMQGVFGLCTDFLKKNKKLIVTRFEQLREVFGNDEENQSPPLLSLVEHLKLESLSELRWIMNNVPTHSVCFQNLLVLEIDGCSQLNSLFPLSAVQTITSLQQLKIRNCIGLRSVFTESESSDDGETESITYHLPNLKTVDISWCRNIKYVFPVALVGGLTCLQNISLFAADNLCSFFAENNILEAPALENLRVSSCPQLRSFIVQKEAKKSVALKKLDLTHSFNTTNIPLEQRSPGSEYITMGNFEQLFQFQGDYSISKLEDLSISDMIWLRDIWNGPINFARNLRNLNIESCNGLTYIFPMMLTKNLPHLNSLGIRLCEKLEQIIGNDDSSEKRLEFPQLETMSLWGLPSLTSFSPLGYHLVFPNLKAFGVRKCDKMITSFMIDYLTLTVHAKTDQGAPPLDHDINWEIRTPFSLLEYVGEDEGISTSN